MRETITSESAFEERAGERGAALITMLLVSTLLLVAGGALILSSAMSAQTAFDSTAEVQAYYAAEAGMQAALNVLRGNVKPSPAFATETTGVYNELNKINFRDAVDTTRSNKSGDSNPARLSRWISYDTTYTDRVIVSTVGGTYSPLSGTAYSVTVTDPDDPTGATRASNSSYEPTRLLLSVKGYGPRTSEKQLDMVVGRAMFNIQPPAPIVIRGADDGSSMTFNLGNSNAKGYTGVDFSHLETTKPSVAVNLSDWSEAYGGIFKPDSINDPEVSVLDYFNGSAQTLPAVGSWPNGANWRPYPLSTDGVDGRNPPAEYPTLVTTPSFLKTADAARAFLYGPTGLMELAKSQNKYVTSFSGALGSDTNPQFLFVDGDATLDSGAGLLVCTGTLTLNGGDDFHGLILVMGTGNVIRSGSGNGGVLGAWIVARFNRTSGNFLAPSFDVSGGGNGDFDFDSASRDKANLTGGRSVLGMVEK